MARLAVAAAVFTALVLIAAAHRTIVGDNPSQQKCRKQIKKQNLTQCEQYLVEREQMLQGQEFLLNPEQKKKHLRPCCNQVEKLDTKCRCMGLKQIVEQLRERGELQVEEVEDMEDSARRLPSDCDLEPHSCKF